MGFISQKIGFGIGFHYITDVVEVKNLETMC